MRNKSSPIDFKRSEVSLNDNPREGEYQVIYRSYPRVNLNPDGKAYLNRVRATADSGISASPDLHIIIPLYIKRGSQSLRNLIAKGWGV
ncbi:MAG: hypothetical protein IIB40_07680 [Candidatus Marinimicrobia bacterium]|nr:hypothetical protein [Candidatus Neomarinimicrobiota bacterium]